MSKNSRSGRPMWKAKSTKDLRIRRTGLRTLIEPLHDGQVLPAEPGQLLAQPEDIAVEKAEPHRPADDIERRAIGGGRS